MDDIIGLLFLLALAVIAGLRKLAEKTQQKRAEGQSSSDAEELPERTRQILYGDEETARQAEAQAEMAASAPPARRQGPLAPTREAVEATIRQVRQQYEQARLRERQQRAAAQRRARPAAQPQEEHEGHDADRRRRAQAQATRERQQQERLALARRQPRQRLFANLGEVRRGIVMSEILGPPKGLS